MTNEVSAEQQAEFEARWNAAGTSLMPKLQAFAEALEPNEQGVLGYLLRELQPEGDDTAGFHVKYGTFGPDAGHAVWHWLNPPPPPPPLALGRTEMPVHSAYNLTKPSR